MNALDRQEGGNHYKRFTIQPIEFTTASFYDPAAHSIVKYVLRHGDKGGLEDLRKADHFAELRHDLIGMDPALRRLTPQLWESRGRKITGRYFCTINQIAATETHAILALEHWIERGMVSAVEFSNGFQSVRDAINSVARTRYGVML